jgi:hypothetical protein
MLIVQGISTTFTDHMPTFHVFRKVHSMLASTVYHLVSQVLGMKRHSLKQHQDDISTHSFYPVHEFVIYKNNSYIVYEIFIVLCFVTTLYMLHLSDILCVHGLFYILLLY